MGASIAPAQSNGLPPAPLYQPAFSRAATYEGMPASLRDFLRVINRSRTMVLAIVGIVTLGVLAQQLLSPNMYSSTAHVQVQLIDEVGLNQADIESRNNQRVFNAVRLHRSRSAAEHLIREIGLLEDEEFAREIGTAEGSPQERLQAATNALLAMVDVTTEPNSDLLEVTVTSRSPTLSAEIANQLPKSVRAVRNSIANARKEALVVELEEELETRGETARDASQKVADFRRENNLLVGAGGMEDFAQLNRIAAAAAQASSARAGSAARASEVSNAASIASTAQATSPALDQLERQKAELLAERSSLAPNHGPNHPDMVRVTSALEAVQANIVTERQIARANAQMVNQADAARMSGLAQSEASREAATAARLEAVSSVLEQQAYKNVAASVKLDELVRASQLADQAYQSIADRLEQVRAQMQLEGVSTLVVSPAVPSYDPVSPSPLKTTILAFLGSLTFACMAAFTKEFLDDKLRTGKQVMWHFNLPTFGMLPLMPQEDLDSDPNDNPVIEDPRSLFAEVARSAYTDVRALREAPGSQVVLITSPLPGDGKSTVSLTLAAAGAAAGDRTIVLDLDLRKKGIVQRLQEPIEAPDLIDLIAGKIDLDAVIPALPDETTEEERFGEEEEPSEVYVLSANKPIDSPGSIISSRKLLSLIAALRERFDLVVINAPAALAVRDARTMCDYADQTLMVARWGRTTSEQMRAALELLQYRASGVIFDHVDYAEHARRRYGDSVQFYVDASDYYSDYFAPPADLSSIKDRILNRFRRLRQKDPDQGAWQAENA